MLIEAKNILDLPVATLDEKEKIGAIKKILVQRSDAKVLGFLVNTKGFLFGKNLFLSESDVLDIDKHGLTTRSRENLINPEEVARVKKLLTERFSLFGLRAVTRSKKRLGKISNFIVDTNTLQVVKFYTRGFFEDRIIDYKNVYKITKKEIIFIDEVSSAKIKKAPEKILAIE